MSTTRKLLTAVGFNFISAIAGGGVTAGIKVASMVTGLCAPCSDHTSSLPPLDKNLLNPNNPSIQSRRPIESTYATECGLVEVDLRSNYDITNFSQQDTTADGDDDDAIQALFDQRFDSSTTPYRSLTSPTH